MAANSCSRVLRLSHCIVATARFRAISVTEPFQTLAVGTQGVFLVEALGQEVVQIPVVGQNLEVAEHPLGGSFAAEAG